jgi:hypothetical protein
LGLKVGETTFTQILSEPETDKCDRCHRTTGFVGICFFLLGDVGDDAVTIPDYLAIGLLAVCLMLWAATVLAPKS